MVLVYSMNLLMFVFFMFPMCTFVIYVSASLNIINVDVKRVSSSALQFLIHS